jgi:PAS domain S-box-containing protein
VVSTSTPLSLDAQAILESMGDAFYALDSDWRIVYANQRALAFWQVTADDVIGRIIWERFPHLIGTLNEQVLRRVRAEQQAITFEAPSPTTGIWVSVNVGPSGDGVTVYWRDISQRIEAEQALRSFAGQLEREVVDRTRALSEAVEELRRSRERYSAVFEYSPVDLLFMAVRADGRIVCEDANPAWVRHSGYSREAVVGRSLEEILPPEQAEFANMQYRRVIESAAPVEYEYTAQFPIGEVSRRSFLVPLPGDSGRIDHVLLTSVDLTEMRRVEAQLRQAQKMEAIGQLTGGVAHDFNNLLTAVIGNLELLQSRLTDEHSLSHVDAALRSALRGGQLTQQLLAYARRQNLSPRPVDVNAAIVGMGELLQRSLGGLVQVTTDLATDLWPATADPTQLELVVLNLAINSRDAMPTGGQLRIATGNVKLREGDRVHALDPGDYVRIAVTDTGTGMPRDVMARAFEPFFTTKEVGKGSGLGLAQVYGVATQFGGTVRLASEPGVGTTVEVFLPRAVPAPASTAATEAHATDGIGGGGTILVVDDDPDVREITAILLREAGYVVKEAGSGHQARDMLTAGPVGLALVDYAMPMMSGHEFARLARQIQPNLPVIYVTGAADTPAPGEPQSHDPVVMKPYARAALLRIVRDKVLRMPGPRLSFTRP